MSLRLRIVALALSGVLAGLPAHATDAGFQTLTVPGTSAAKPITVALYYPTQAAARAIPMGPFTPQVAPGGTPDASVRGLIVLSHGTGGSELGHTSAAEALARHGYLVAALRHPGDNWQDRSLPGSAAFFTERPRQASRVIDALLASPQWSGRIASDAQGPKVGAVGHSAGGYTVLALGGALADVALLRTHCKEAADDQVFCNTGSDGTLADVDPAKGAAPVPVSVEDPRVRAVAALAPVGAVFGVASLRAMHVPTLVMVSEKDGWLPVRYHAEPLKNNIPAVDYRVVPNASHFAFMNTPGMPIPTPDGDAGADLPGFDRAAFQARLGQALVAFFDAHLK